MAKVNSQGSASGLDPVQPVITGREYALVRVIREQQVVISALKNEPTIAGTPGTRSTTVVDGVLSGVIPFSQV